jgi:hypothetical protein
VCLERGPLSLVSTLEELTELYPSAILIAVRVLGYRSRSPGFLIFWKVAGLERGPLSLVSTLEELTELYSFAILIVVRKGTWVTLQRPGLRMI